MPKSEIISFDILIQNRRTDFFDGDEFEVMLGKKVDYRRTNRGATLTVKAESEEELRETLDRLLEPN